MLTETNKALFGFIDASPTGYHAVAVAAAGLTAKGFLELHEGNEWLLTAGGNYFVTRNGSSIIAFSVPKKEFLGFNIISSHSDSPSFKLKENAVVQVEKAYTKLNTEGYGGMIMSSWQDRPLSIAGRVILKTNCGTESRLVDFRRPLLVIPNLAIHMQREINNGYKFNPQVDMLPLFGSDKADFIALLVKELGVRKEELLSADLFLYPVEKGCAFGAEEEFISSPRLDDLQCVYSSLAALTESKNSECVRVCAVFDNEEVGSGTKQGAASTFLFDVLTRLSDSLGKTAEQYRMALTNSFMLSADNAHAVHPNFADKSDSTNRSFLNKGIVIKFNANQKYTTDAVSSSIFRLICDRAQVPVQVFQNRSDMPGGSTLGNISNAKVSLNTVDIGIPQLAMHSAVETAGAFDTEHMKNAMSAFYRTAIEQGENGSYRLKEG